MTSEVPEGWYDAGTRGMQRYWTGDEWTDRERVKPPREHRPVSTDGVSVALLGVLSLVLAPLFVFSLMAVRVARGADEEDTLVTTGRSIALVGLVLGALAWLFLLLSLLRSIAGS